MNLFTEKGYMYTYVWVPLLSTWNYHNIANKLYSSVNKKFNKKMCKFKMYTVTIWYTHTLWNDHHVGLVSISVTLVNYHFFLVVRIFKIYSVSSFQVWQYSIIDHYGHALY